MQRLSPTPRLRRLAPLLVCGGLCSCSGEGATPVRVPAQANLPVPTLAEAAVPDADAFTGTAPEPLEMREAVRDLDHITSFRGAAAACNGTGGQWSAALLTCRCGPGEVFRPASGCGAAPALQPTGTG
jgi:hypothetical protein